MKLITAIIRGERLDMVREALMNADITRVTVSRCTGHGRAQNDTEIYRGKEINPDLIPKVRLDIAVNEDFVDRAVQAIMTAARSGNIGDGKIIVTPVDNVYRIRTGEEGGDAV